MGGENAGRLRRPLRPAGALLRGLLERPAGSLFFLVPFTLAYILLRELPWDRRLLVWALLLVAAEAIAFVLIGSVEYASRSLFWNQAVIRSNEFHTYFRVNSVFWDPNIYGRYLALVLVVVTTVMLWIEGRPFWLLAGRSWCPLARPRPDLSQSSFIALLAGLAVLAALRWSWRWTVGAGRDRGRRRSLVVLFVGGKVAPPQPFNVDTWAEPTWSPAAPNSRRKADLGIRLGLVPAGVHEPPPEEKARVTISHTEPVTVAAEQGLVGLIAYVGLIGVALWTMGAGLWHGVPSRGPPTSSSPAPPCSPRSSLCSSTPWPTRASSRIRSPGCSWP